MSPFSRHVVEAANQRQTVILLACRPGAGVEIARVPGDCDQRRACALPLSTRIESTAAFSPPPQLRLRQQRTPFSTARPSLPSTLDRLHLTANVVKVRTSASHAAKSWSRPAVPPQFTTKGRRYLLPAGHVYFLRDIQIEFDRVFEGDLHALLVLLA